jgi:hypothetical protein
MTALRNVGHRTLRDIGLGDDQAVDSYTVTGSSPADSASGPQATVVLRRT